jgi:hypothetical protein
MRIDWQVAPSLGFHQPGVSRYVLADSNTPGNALARLAIIDGLDARQPLSQRCAAMESRASQELGCSLCHNVVHRSLRNFKSEALGSVEKRRLTTGTKVVVQFNHDRMSGNRFTRSERR